jgi:hypothetical protein
MLYRDCRIKTYKEIFNQICPELNDQDLFLLLGGIKNNVYILKYKSIHFFYFNGFDMLLCPQTFDLFNISYEELNVSDFLETYKKNDKFPKENLFVMPFHPTILNKGENEGTVNALFDYSYLPISRVDYTERKIIFKDINANEFVKEEWIAFDILNDIHEECLWLDEKDRISEYIIYSINKEALKKCERVSRLLKFDRIKKLNEVAKQFLLNNSYHWEEEKTTQLTGIQVYDYIHNSLNIMKNELLNNDNIEKENLILKYARFQLIKIRYFILSGTDGYYRNEFSDVVSSVASQYQSNELIKNANEWKQIAKIWRNVSRCLNKFIHSKKRAIDVCETIDELLISTGQIEQREVNAVEELIKISNDLL